MKKSLVFCLLALFLAGPAAADEKDRREPFTFVDTGFCSFGHCVTRELKTPAGSRMVIETFSMAIKAADGATVASFGLGQRTEDGGTTFLHFAPADGPNQIPHVTGASEFIVSQQVRVYPDPALPVVLFTESEDEESTYAATISGYFLSLKSRTLSP